MRICMGLLRRGLAVRTLDLHALGRTFLHRDSGLVRAGLALVRPRRRYSVPSRQVVKNERDQLLHHQA
jgi:hypothetical protein